MDSRRLATSQRLPPSPSSERANILSQFAVAEVSVRLHGSHDRTGVPCGHPSLRRSAILSNGALGDTLHAVICGTKHNLSLILADLRLDFTCRCRRSRATGHRARGPPTRTWERNFSGPTSEGALVHRIRHGNNLSERPAAVHDIMRSRCQIAGIEGFYAAHSLHASFVTGAKAHTGRFNGAWLSRIDTIWVTSGSSRYCVAR